MQRLSVSEWSPSILNPKKIHTIWLKAHFGLIVDKPKINISISKTQYQMNFTCFYLVFQCKLEKVEHDKQNTTLKDYVVILFYSKTNWRNVILK